jgi:hypothetical protein
MKKISYKNKPIEKKPEISVEDLLSVTEAEEGALGIGRGLAMPGEPVMPAMYSEEEERPVFTNKKRRKTHNVNYDELSDLLVGLSDEMDKQGSVDFANFSDFLIRKIAEQKAIDYLVLYNNLLIKITNSDIFEKNDILISVNKQYSSVFKKHMDLGEDVLAAKRNAYQAAASKAKRYVK